jgi:hypothetical protein
MDASLFQEMQSPELSRSITSRPAKSALLYGIGAARRCSFKYRILGSIHRHAREPPTLFFQESSRCIAWLALNLVASRISYKPDYYDLREPAFVTRLCCEQPQQFRLMFLRAADHDHHFGYVSSLPLQARTFRTSQTMAGR